MPAVPWGVAGRSACNGGEGCEWQCSTRDEMNGPVVDQVTLWHKNVTSPD
jgi:hypothetical protein